MLGWNIGVYRFADAAAVELLAGVAADPLDKDAKAMLWNVAPGKQVAVWQSGISGLDWIRALARAGRAAELPSNGYPNRYFARAGDLLPVVFAGPPDVNETWVSGPSDVITARWAGRTVIDRDTAEACSQQEWLLIEAWDES